MKKQPKLSHLILCAVVYVGTHIVCEIFISKKTILNIDWFEVLLALRYIL
jgi:hypothetical protein